MVCLMATSSEILEAQAKVLSIDDWRHPYEIDGKPINLSSKRFARWHHWRWSIDQPILDQALQGFDGKSVLDVACNDGWYGFQAEKLGAHVVGVEGREDAFERANLLKTALRRKNISFRQMDIEHPDADVGGPYDATLFYGILYHLADPARVLARFGAATRRIIAVQSFTHISDQEARLYLFREDTQLPGAALHPLITRPTPAAIVMMLKCAGFDYVYRVNPPDAPTRSDPNWIWSFFFGVKGGPIPNMEPLGIYLVADLPRSLTMHPMKQLAVIVGSMIVRL